MINRFYFLLSFLAVAQLGYAKIIPTIHDSLKTKHVKLYILEFDDQPPAVTKHAILDPLTTKKLATISDSSNNEISKLLKVNFVLVVRFKPHTKLLTFNQLMDLYNIPLKDRGLPVFIDDQGIDYPETMLVAQGQIKMVALVKVNGAMYIKISRI